MCLGYNNLMLYLGADHRGFKLKEALKILLKSKNILYQDLGNIIEDKEDNFVEFAKNVAINVSRDQESLGIVICGSGVGVSIVANKIKNIRCGLVFNPEMAKAAKEHDDINILALPADFISIKNAQDAVLMFLETNFLHGEKYQKRIDQITLLELGK